ncbi:hypothetical protein [Desulforhabdus sp. TSK]|uniref:hypothetical protein n=1 Tax=Desulforhabdus sp. TSK TaxID=2925014 RepID=UPI001FC862C5|nr:hypothetical protein [Desulforhabdus sp. TSK]
MEQKVSTAERFQVLRGLSKNSFPRHAGSLLAEIHRRTLDAGLKTAGMTRGEMEISFCGRVLSVVLNKKTRYMGI